MTGCGWQGTSALGAWLANKNRQHLGHAGVRRGDALYFGPHPENGNYGHTGIWTGTDEFTSVTFGGVQRFPVSKWVAPLLGYIRYW